MKVILTGATGYVGEGVLLALLDDERTGKRVGAVTIEKRTTLTGSPLRLSKLN